MAKKHNLPHLLFQYIFFGLSLFSSIWFIYLHQDQVYVYKKLFLIIYNGDFDLGLPAGFLLDLFLGIITLFLYYWVGKSSLHILSHKMDLKRELSSTLNLPVGMGIIYLIFLLPAITFQLNRPVIISIGALLAVILYRFRVKDEHEEIKKIVRVESQKNYLYWCASFLLAVIIFLSFYHALLYPESYWDSLIYYLHYGKMTYQQHGFPILYTAQVGLALGANYPHIYHLLCAVPAVLFGHYTDLYGQLLSPVAGLFATILIYQTILILFKNRLTAILSALVFRSIPFVNVYLTYATDYSLVMLYAVGLFYVATAFYRTKHPFFLILAGFLVGILPNINYLGWIFVPLLLLMGIYSYLNSTHPDKLHYKDAMNYVYWALGICFLVGIPWYVRNYFVTGNPVYAFFPGIFGGKRINMEVLKSCFVEWSANGIGVPGKTFLERVINAPGWLFQIWQVNPFFYGIAVPTIGYSLFIYPSEKKEPLKTWFIISTGLMAFGGILYHLLVSNLYLYQIIFVFPVLVLMGAIILQEAMDYSRYIRNGIYSSIIVMAIIPGISMSLMGPKLMSPGLEAFANPGMKPERFYAMKLGNYENLLEYTNSNLKNSVILTHENRYHLFDDSIQIRHLDDWDIQPLYQEKDSLQIAKTILQKGIGYYLYIPNEQNHPILRKLQIKDMIEKQYLTLIYDAGDYKLYKFNLPE